MINIRPVSDLRNKFTDIEELVKEGQAVYLTKNGYGTMVVLSIETYSNLVDSVEIALDAADYQAEHTDVRLQHEDVFGALRGKLNAK